jgi:hypothetical protein
MTATIRVLDPTAAGPSQQMPPAAGVASLEGRVLGLRVDDTWQSFTHFAEVVREEALRRWRVREVIVFDPGTRHGTTEEEQRRVEGFVRDIDMAVVGLGT